jgi:hypothetical protein
LIRVEEQPVFLVSSLWIVEWLNQVRAQQAPIVQALHHERGTTADASLGANWREQASAKAAAGFHAARFGVRADAGVVD